MAKLQNVGPGVFYSNSPTLPLRSSDIEWLQREAERTAHGRARICAHANVEEKVHEMLICLTRRSYIRPHRHLKSESLHVIAGECELVLFDDDGEVVRVLALGAPATGASFFVRLSEPVYHTLLLKTDSFLFHETTAGPLDRAQTAFADWAPPEEDQDASSAFVEQVRASADRWLCRQSTAEE